MNLTPGGNAPVPAQALTVKVLSGMPVDVSAFRLFADGKVRGDADMVFYGQPTNDDNTVSQRTDGSDTLFSVDLPRMRSDVQKIAFTATCDSVSPVSQLRRLAIQVEHNGNVLVQGEVDLNGRQEAALIVGELYRRNDEWKFRFVSQGFNGGLRPLAEHFGVNISDDAPASPPPAPAAAAAPAPVPPPAAPVSLSKVSLTKEKSTISLSKQDDFGEIRINLNWHRGNAQGGGGKGFFQNMFGSGGRGSGGIDLDLGAFIELSDGQRTVIQALGNRFGDLNYEPYVQLQGDDRTGDVTDGEWMRVNGREWKRLKEVLIFAFIYEGAPNWDSTDGVVTIYVNGQPPIETRLTEGNNNRSMCAVARLVNEGGSIKVERINRYFGDHQEMDQAFGWGFRWKAGSK